MLYIINAACVDHEGHLSLIPFYFVSHKKIIVDDFEKEFPDIIETVSCFLEEKGIEAEIIIYPAPSIISGPQVGLYAPNGLEMEIIPKINFDPNNMTKENIRGKIERIG